MLFGVDDFRNTNMKKIGKCPISHSFRLKATDEPVFKWPRIKAKSVEKRLTIERITYQLTIRENCRANKNWRAYSISSSYVNYIYSITRTYFDFAKKKSAVRITKIIEKTNASREPRVTSDWENSEAKGSSRCENGASALPTSSSSLYPNIVQLQLRKGMPCRYKEIGAYHFSKYSSDQLVYV